MDDIVLVYYVLVEEVILKAFYIGVIFLYVMTSQMKCLKG